LKILQIVGGREGRGGREGGEGGWRIVIPRPEAINFVDGRKLMAAGKKHIISWPGMEWNAGLELILQMFLPRKL
jgi:hypothetical protein